MNLDENDHSHDEVNKLLHSIGSSALDDELNHSLHAGTSASVNHMNHMNSIHHDHEHVHSDYPSIGHDLLNMDVYDSLLKTIPFNVGVDHTPKQLMDDHLLNDHDHDHDHDLDKNGHHGPIHLSHVQQPNLFRMVLDHGQEDDDIEVDEDDDDSDNDRGSDDDDEDDEDDDEYFQSNNLAENEKQSSETDTAKVSFDDTAQLSSTSEDSHARTAHPYRLLKKDYSYKYRKSSGNENTVINHDEKIDEHKAPNSSMGEQIQSDKQSENKIHPKKRRKHGHPSQGHGTHKKGSSSAHLPSHNTPWNPQEQALFEEGIRLYGKGNWKGISQIVQTRNPLQVKNHARQYFKKLARVNALPAAPSKDSKNKAKEMIELGSTIVHLDKKEEANEDSEIDIGEEDTPVHSGGYQPESKDMLVMDIGGDLHKMKDHLGTSIDHDDGVTVAVNTNTPALSHQDHETSDQHEYEDAEEDMYEQHMHFPEPIVEKILDPNVAMDEEKIFNKEFFCGNSVKTPERYLKIRNTIVNSWKAIKPKYLSKTAIRAQLKDCGDVNAIGRVHEYLEMVGAINFGAKDRPKVSVSKKQRWLYNISSLGRKKPSINQETFSEFSKMIDETLGVGPKRKRKVRSKSGAWVFEEDLKREDHTTIIHDEETNQHQHHHIFHSHHHSKSKYKDPFRLVTCEKFDSLADQPFHLSVSSDALLIMDIHSHLLHTEVIGLLGGFYYPDKSHLHIQIALPCNSQSTGIQCEMDPMSEMQAREFLSSMSLQVVGWYHTHVMWAPNPSVRDIETQSNYQNLFANKELNVEPFVGVIVAPYDQQSPSEESVFNWFWVKQAPPHNDVNITITHTQTQQTQQQICGHRATNALGTPMELQCTTHHESTFSHNIMQLLLQLVELYQNDSDRVDFNDSWEVHSKPKAKLKHITKWEKFKCSILSKLPVNLSPLEKEDLFLTLQRKLNAQDSNDNNDNNSHMIPQTLIHM